MFLEFLDHWAVYSDIPYNTELASLRSISDFFHTSPAVNNVQLPNLQKVTIHNL